MHLHSQVESLPPSGNWMSVSVDHRDPWDRRVSFVQFGGRKFDVFALRQCRTLIWFLHLLWQLGSEGSQFNSCQKKRSFFFSPFKAAKKNYLGFFKFLEAGSVAFRAPIDI